MPVARRWFISRAAAALGVAVLAHSHVFAHAQMAERTAPLVIELVSADVVTVEPTFLRDALRVSGQLRPVARVAVKTKVSGTVLEVLARPGEKVSKGDLLVRFETDDLNAALAQQESGLESARAVLLLAQQALEKAEQLARRGFASKATLEKAQSDLATASANVKGLEAQLGTARQALANAEIRAPFDGVVATRSVEPGETASSGAEVMTVVDASTLEAEVLVSTRDVARIGVGKEVVLSVEGGDGTVTGIIDRISPVANDGSRSVPVFVRVGNGDGRLWGGMFVTGEIELRRDENALAVPATAVREDQEGLFVMKVEDGKAVRQPVTVVAEWKNGSLLQVGSGLAAGDVVVALPIKGLEPGGAVAVQSFL